MLQGECAKVRQNDLQLWTAIKSRVLRIFIWNFNRILEHALALYANQNDSFYPQGYFKLMPKVGVGRFYGVIFWPLPGFTSWDTLESVPVRLASSPGADWCKALLRWSDRWSHKLKRERRQKFWWKTRPGWFRNLVTFFRFKVLRRLWPFIVSRGSCTFMGSVLLNKVNRKSWTLQPSALNMSIKLGTTKSQNWPGSKNAELWHHQPHALPD